VAISDDQRVLLATPQKALVDLLYLTPHSDQIEYLRELRLERPENFDLDELRKAADRSSSAKVVRGVRRVVALWKEEV
jgi:hypothetical protein